MRDPLEDRPLLVDLRASADVAQLALERMERRLALHALPPATQSDSARQLARRRLENQLHETKIQLARLQLELDRAALGGRL